MEDTQGIPSGETDAADELISRESVNQLLARYRDISRDLRQTQAMSPENGYLMGQQLQLKENLSLLGQADPADRIDSAYFSGTEDSLVLPAPARIIQPDHQAISELLSNYRRLYALSLMPEITNYDPGFLNALFRPRSTRDRRQFNAHSINLVKGKVGQLKEFLSSLNLGFQLDGIHTSTESLMKHDPERFRQQVREVTYSSHGASTKQRLADLKEMTEDLSKSDKIDDSSED